MAAIIFVKTRYHYDAYIDFWKLVELSGFDTCYVDEVDISKPRFYIVTPMNGEWRPHIGNQVGKPHNAYLVQWCLERPSGADGMGNYARDNRSLIYDRYLDDVWVSDRAMASEAMLRYVTLGSDYGLGEPYEGIKKYDFVHMSYVCDRRARVYGQYDAKLIAPNCWPPERDSALKLSRFALNIHQDQYPFQEPLRWALFAAYGIPMLTESVKDAYPWNEDVCVFHPYDGIIGRLHEMVGNDYSRWRGTGLRARDMMCKRYRFRDIVIDAVRTSK